MPADVVHVPGRSRFEAHEDGRTARLTYELEGDRVIFTHTVVPPEIEGRGVGSRLAAAGVGWAREQGLRVVPQCSFVRAWLDRQQAGRCG